MLYCWISYLSFTAPVIRKKEKNKAKSIISTYENIPEQSFALGDILYCCPRKRVYMCIDMNLQRDIGFDFFFLSVSRLHGLQMNVLQKTGLL